MVLVIFVPVYFATFMEFANWGVLKGALFDFAICFTKIVNS